MRYTIQRTRAALRSLMAAAILGSVMSGASHAETLRIGVTTSFENSGISDVLMSAFQEETDIKVELIVFGTKAVLKLAQNGEVDGVIVHAPALERDFVARGFAPYRREIMYNDFVIIGPDDDPAGVRGARDAVEALSNIARQRSTFVSRGDESGTHHKEMALWQRIQTPPGRWYRSTGSGMGATINHAVAIGGYTLSDRGSWLNFGNKRDNTIVFEGDPDLNNQYSFLPVSPDRHPHVAFASANTLEAFLTSPRGQRLIDEFRIGGERAFFANSKPR